MLLFLEVGRELAFLYKNYKNFSFLKFTANLIKYVKFSIHHNQLLVFPALSWVRFSSETLSFDQSMLYATEIECFRFFYIFFNFSNYSKALWIARVQSLYSQLIIPVFLCPTIGISYLLFNDNNGAYLFLWMDLNTKSLVSVVLKIFNMT